MSYKPFFEKTTRPGIGAVNSTEFGRVEFKSLTLGRAVQLWHQGCPYIALTPEGARKLFGDMPAAERISLLKKCRTPQEVAAIVALSRTPTKAMKEAEAKRLNELAE